MVSPLYKIGGDSAGRKKKKTEKERKEREKRKKERMEERKGRMVEAKKVFGSEKKE